MELNHRYLVQNNVSSNSPLEEWYVIEESEKAFKFQREGGQVFWELKADVAKNYTVIEDLGVYGGFMPHHTPNPFPFMGDPNIIPYTGTPPDFHPSTSPGIPWQQMGEMSEAINNSNHPDTSRCGGKCGGNCKCGSK